MIKKISYYIGIVFLWILTIGAASEAKTVIGSIVILIPLIILMLRQYLGMKARKFQKELSEAKNNYEEMIKPDMNILKRLQEEQKSIMENIEKQKKDLNTDIQNLEERKKQITNEIEILNEKLSPLNKIDNLNEIISKLEIRNEELTITKNELRIEKNRLIEEIEKKKIELHNFRHEERNIVALEKVKDLYSALDKLSKKEESQKNKLKKIKQFYDAIKYAVDNYFIFVPESFNIKLENKNEINEMLPSITLHLHNMDVKELNKAFKENYKQIDETLNKVSDRYTTKTNIMVYKLMVIALKAELQNILYDLKYNKLDKAIENIKSITNKYANIASEGNQVISKTMAQFIGVLEYQFINAAKIEYNYYIKQEQIKQEQIALRQQLREEAEERRLLKLERERIEREEEKFRQEIERTQEILQNSQDNGEIQNLKMRILELQGQLSDVTIKKEEIINLQNGKAGNIYIISNLGSFGDKVFKIGMTRRLDPQERINELGSASVPFKFDVHSFIFSENAVELEKALHKRLNDKRVNKVNLRKEFFYSTVDELEELVNELDSTAVFNKTMLAEEYNQTISVNNKGYEIEN
nr:MAG TPA: helicase [Caudoviricetes sp.]